MKTNFKFISFLFLLVFGLTAVAFGQERTGDIEGTVVDQNDAVVAGAQVQVSGVNIGFSRSLTANSDGTFRLLQVPPGNYKITTTASGFRDKTSEFAVALGQTSAVTVKLEVGSGGPVTVDVTGSDAAPIDTESNTVQKNISARQTELTPKANINFSGVLRTAPAVREEPLGAGFNIDGSSGAENTFIVDGLEVTNFRSGQLRNVQNISNDAVSEVQVKTSGFDAEFGGATGGVVTVVSKGGVNGLNGQFGTQFNIDKFDADTRPILRALDSSLQYITPRSNGGTFLNPPDDEFTNFFPTGRLGGSIVRDRLWFFASAAPQYFDTTRRSVFPDGSSQTNSSRQRNDYLFARLDGQVFDKLRLTGTYSYSPQTINGNLLGFGNTSPVPNLNIRGGRVNTTNFTYSGVYTPTSNLVFSVRGGRAFLNEKDGAYGVPSGFRVRCSGSQTVLNTLPGFGCGATNAIGFDNIGDTTQVFQDVSIRNTLDADASVVVGNLGGRHIFKFGYQLNKVINDVDSGFFNLGQFRYFFGQTAFGVGSALGNAQLTRFGTVGVASSTNTGLYAQDSWQIARRLTLNLGIRIEKENVPSFSDTGVPIEFNFGDKVAPRLGFAYDLFGDGKTKIFGSYGLFYDRFKYELPRGSFGGDQFLRTFIPILATDTVNTFTNIQSVLAAATARGGITLDFRVPSNDPSDNRIDPDLRAQQQAEFTIGFERELFRNTVLRGRYTHKQLNHTIEDVGFFDNDGNENFFIANPGEGLVAAPFASGIPGTPLAERKYDAFEITFDKRFSSNYFVNATYTYSRLFGNYSGLASSDERGRSSPNVNRFFDLPFLGFDLNGNPDNGRLATDRPHAVKIFGGYTYDWFNKSNATDFTVAFLGTSGTPISTQVSLFNANTFVFGRGDLGRTDLFTQTDFAITHRYKFGQDGRFGLAFEVNLINLFNENNVTDVYNIITASSLAGTQGAFNLFSGCLNNVCDELNTIRRVFSGGIRDRVLQLVNTQVQIGTTAAGAPVFDTITPDARYGQPLSFQTNRQVRFGFRFSF